ncbi:hypothetical protein JCM3770_003472 [Rhodotorula araucariae]
MSLGKCCISGYKHDGTPVGKIEQVAGVRTYVTLPQGDYDKDKALLFLTDIFGVDSLPNGLLLADSFAANGFATYMPDYLNGDPVPQAAYKSGEFDLGTWFGSHGADATRPPVDKVLAQLRSQGVKRVAAIGFCFGGRYVADLVLDDAVNVGIVAHPSLLKVPDDIEALAKKDTPFLWNHATEDVMFNKDQQKLASEILKGKDAHKEIHWEGATHGFAIRGDPTDPQARQLADGAFEESVKFLKAKL